MSEINDLTKFVDNSVRLQDDFFSYVNGKWYEETVIPEDKARWGSFMVLREKSIQNVKNLLESDEFTDNNFKKVKKFYEEGMNIERRNKLDIEPIKKYLDEINSIASKEDLVSVLLLFAEKNLASVFSFSSQIDRKDTSREVPHFYSSGLSLPGNKDYYTDPDKKEIRDKFVEFITTLFTFINLADPERKAKTVLEFETRLADKHCTPVQKRDPELTYNAIESLDELKKYVPNIDWNAYFGLFTDIEITKTVLDNPDYFKLLNNLLTEPDLDEWKIYLTARLLNGEAQYLSERFVQAHFNFYGKVINGTKKLEELHKQILSVINDRFILGELVGKYYVQKYFPQTSKDKMTDLVKNLLEIMGERIKNLEWMGEETKEKGLNKLRHFNFKIGYPDEWEDYSALTFEDSDTYFDVVNKSILHIRQILLLNLYKAPNQNQWSMSPQTINAYYHPFRNEIVFPAGILQFPFFDEHMSDAENYGGIGAVIGHEITHGFDDKGSKFDYDGNMVNWWTENDSKQFTEKGKYLVGEYEKFLVNGKPLNGELTLGENIADHGGIKIAYQAMQLNYKKEGKREDDKMLSSEEKFFYSFARIWREKRRPEIDEQFRMTDPHSHPKARVNVTLSNISEFHNTFKIKEGDKLYRKELPNIW